MSKADETKADEKPKAEKPKRITVQIIRAVDNYHHRNRIINVPDDAYHRGLLTRGLLKKVDG
jgi:hypothetical protein